MQKQYSFLNEVLTAIGLGTYALSHVPTALGVYGLSTGAYNTIKNARQNSFNSKYMNLMYNELYRCNDRVKAKQIVDKYSRLLTQMYTNVNKGTAQKLSNMQQFINVNFRRPLLKIINNQQDVNWKNSCLTYFKTNMRNIKIKNTANTALSGAGIAAGTALMGGVGNGVVAGVSTGVFVTRVAINQLKVFNGTKYINKMIAELQRCNDNDRETALKIVQKYCYDITNTIQGYINKTGSKIPFDVQTKMRNQFLFPLQNIIYDEKSVYWKIQLIDYLETQKLEELIRNICDSFLRLLLPKILPATRTVGRR